MVWTLESNMKPKDMRRSLRETVGVGEIQGREGEKEGRIRSCLVAIMVT